jgi:hypothetical protein
VIASDTTVHTSERANRRTTIAVYIVAQLAYLLTLAPTVLWGDQAKFQRFAATGFLRANVYDHPLWVTLAQPFMVFPIGDAAFRANLAASFWAALTMAFVFALLQRLTQSNLAAWIGAIALGASHTFWSMSVQAEVYTLNTLLLAVALYALTAPRLAWQLLLVAGIACGLAVNNHLMMWLPLPGVLLLAIGRGRRQGLPLQSYIPALLGFGAAYAIYSLYPPDPTLDSSAGALAAFLPNLPALPRQLARFAAFVVLQFPSPALLFALYGVWRLRHHGLIGASLGLILLADIAAVLNHEVPDQYVFYIPAYFTLAIIAGLGASGLPTRLRSKITTGVVTSIVVAPIALYTLLPAVLPSLGIGGERLGAREIPGRPALSFFLTPYKTGYMGARQFSEATLTALPSDAALIADYTVAEPMRYLQDVEGVRPDVSIASTAPGEQLAIAQRYAQQRSIYLPLSDPRYYDLEGLGTIFNLEPWRDGYQLVPKADD